VILFGVAFPIAPFIALFQNFLQVRVDGFKMVKFTKRGRCRNVTGIGVWSSILELMT